MGRSPCCEKVGLKKGPWTPEEDQKLLAFIEENGHGSWRALPAKAGLQRCGKSCRLRWTNYLRPDIKRGTFSLQEEQTIIQLHALLGNRWSAIATHLPKRTDNEIKNYWNTHLKKRLAKMGIDPVTHKLKTDALGPAQVKDAANLSHMAQWENARLEAESRLVRESKLHVSANSFQSSHQVGSSSTAQLLNKAIARTPTPPPLCLDILTAWKGTWLKTEKDNNALTGTFFPGGGCFTTAGILESPTSTLNFSCNPYPAMNGGSFSNHSLAAIDLGKYSINNFSNIKQRMENEMELQQGMAYYNNNNSMEDEYIVAESLKATVNGNLILPNFMEGLTDLLVDNSGDLISSSNNRVIINSDNVGESCCGDVEENKNYWNNILVNLVNCSPSNAPVF